MNDSIALIDAISQAQGSPTGGIALDKEAMSELMITKALQLAGQLTAYASVTNDETLLKKAQVSRSTFRNARDEARDDIAREIYDLASARLVELKDYGTTAATLSALDTRINVYKAATPTTRAATVHVSTLTAELETELKRTDMIQRDRLDGLMEQFSDSQQMFYGDYKNARKLIDLKGPGKPTPTPPPPGGP